jgi:hypothetical protein
MKTKKGKNERKKRDYKRFAQPLKLFIANDIILIQFSLLIHVTKEREMVGSRKLLFEEK